MAIYSSGIDITDILRIRGLSAEPLFLKMVFTEKELSQAYGKKPAYKYLAMRFAVKEAFMKALGTGWAKGVGWKDVEVIESGDRLSIKTHSEARILLKDRKIHLSVSCSRQMAFALVIIDGN